MDFFEKLGNTISSTSKDVAKKTKDLTEVAKLNSQISKEESLIEKKFYEIGKTFYKKYGITEDSDLKVLCAEVKEAYDKIEVYKNQLSVLKGIVLCPRCGSENSIQSSFCSSCGEKLKGNENIEAKPVEVKVSTEKTCPNCNTTINENVSTCPNCGSKVE